MIDFLAVLFGYTISGERTLEEFYERLAPWADFFSLDLLGKLIMLDVEPLNPAGDRNPRKAAILEEKYIFSLYK